MQTSQMNKVETSRIQPKHIPALDGVRGLAVLAIFVFHYGGGSQSSNHLLNLIGAFVRAGWFSLSVFFLLSGFLISGILWDDRDHPNWWRRFYYRRTLRIFPLYYAALLLVLITAIFAHHARLAFTHIWVLLLYLQNFSQLPSSSEAIGTPLPLFHFWSLAVEEQFYLLWPFLLIASRKISSARTLCLSVFVLSAFFRFAIWMFLANPTAYGDLLPARAGELALGSWLALCYRDPNLWPRIQRLAPSFLCGGLLIFICVGIFEHSFALGSRGMFLFGLPCITISMAGMLTLTLGDGIFAHLFSTAWLRWLGGISYGIYVFHVLLGTIFDWIVVTIAPHASHNIALGLRFIVASTLTLLAAQISFVFFERPILRLRNRLSHRSPIVSKARAVVSS